MLSRGGEVFADLEVLELGVRCSALEGTGAVRRGQRLLLRVPWACGVPLRIELFWICPAGPRFRSRAAGQPGSLAAGQPGGRWPERRRRCWQAGRLRGLAVR